MRLQEVFDQLSIGEFSQLSIGGQEAGLINDANYKNVVNYVNLGLTALYTRFLLKEGRLQLQLQDGQTDYRLNSSFAVNAQRSREAVRYIIDTVDQPFRDDIIKVERVIHDDGYDLPLNDAADTSSVTTPSMLTLRVPEDVDSDALTVVYRAYHPKISPSSDCCSSGSSMFELPYSHLAPLLYYVASRAHAPLGITPQTEFNASNNFMARYETACQELEGQGLQVNVGGTNTRLMRNGWA